MLKLLFTVATLCTIEISLAQVLDVNTRSRIAEVPSWKGVNLPLYSNLSEAHLDRARRVSKTKG